MTRHSTRRVAAWLASGLLTAGLSAAPLLAPSPVEAATIPVSVENYDFAPASRTIVAGDVVRWTFSGDQHSVTSRDGLFDSGITNPGGSFQFTFTKAGTYRYYCVVHPGLMSGTIVVEAGTATPAPTVRPTPRPSPTPTPRPTPKPTPRATARPTTAPTASPAAPTASTAPTASPTPNDPPSPSPSAASSPAILASDVPSSAPTSPVPAPTDPAGATDTTPILALGLVVALVVVLGGLFVARRRAA